MTTKIVSIVAVFLLGLFSIAWAGTVHVPADQPTIQAGIDAAVNGDTVAIAPGTYTGDGNRDISFNGKAIVVMAAAGPGTATIDCEAERFDRHSGFIFNNSEGATSVLQNMIVTGAVADSGGGFLCRNSSPRIVGCEFRGNGILRGRGIGGGGACLDGAAPTIEGCSFVENIASTGGGVALCDGADAIFTNCTFERNLADPFGPKPWPDASGGAAYIKGSSPEFMQCLFKENRASDSLEDQFAVGCIFSWDASPAFRYCTFVRNRAHGSPTSAIHVLLVELGFPEVVNCTFYDNGDPDAQHPSSFGPHEIFSSADGFVLRQSIFAYGRSSAETDALPIIDWEGGPDPEVECNLIYGNQPFDFAGQLGAFKNVDGNYWLEPRFCDTAAGDFHLKANSWASPENNPCGVLIGAWPVDSTCPWVPCCIGTRGNVDNSPDDAPTLGDLTAMIDHLFVSFSPLNCYEEANLDGSHPEGGPESIGLADLTWMIQYMFVLLQDFPPCP